MLYGWCSLYMVRIGISPLLAPIREEFHLTYSQVGLLAMAIFVTYAIMQFPAGYLGDRLGRRTLLLLGIFGWTVITFLTGFCTAFASLFGLRLLTGFFQGAYFGNERPLVAYYTPGDQKASGQGITLMGQGMGMALGMILSGFIADHLGWRWVFILYAFPSLVAGLLVLNYLREPQNLQPAGAMNPDSTFSFRHVFITRNLWFIYLSCFSNGYAFGLLGSWAPSILLETGLQGLTTPSLLAGFLGFTGMAGLYLTGRWSDRLTLRSGTRKSILIIYMLISFALTTFMGTAISFQSSAFPVAVSIIFSSFFLWGFFPPLYALVTEVVPQRTLGTAFGFMNLLTYTGSMLASWLTGWLRDLSGSFAWGMYCSGILIFAGIIFVFLIKADSGSRWESHEGIHGVSSRR